MASGTLHLNVEFSAVTDEEGKFARLAVLLGLADGDHARGKCEHLWLACTRRGESDLPQWLVEQVLGERGPEALIEAELASRAGGRGDSSTRRIRIGGAEKHCLWMVRDQAAKQGQSSKGGKTRAATASRAGGRFTRGPGDDSPAQTSPSEISSASDLPEDQDSLSPAHAIPPSPEPIPPPSPLPSTSPAQSFAERDVVRLRAIGDLALATWTRLSDLRTSHATKLGLTDALPFPTITPGHQPRAFDELRARIREEGDNARTVCDHVIRVLDDQARDGKSIEWLSEKAFLERPWSKARETVLKRKAAARATAESQPLQMSTLSPAERSAVLAEEQARIARILADGARAPPASAIAIADDNQPQARNPA